MFLILAGALLVAVGVALFSVPLGLIVLGLEVVAAGVYLDLITPDGEPEEVSM